VVKLLVREGAEIDKKGKEGNTALHYACFYEGTQDKKSQNTENITNIAVFLVLSRADINIKNVVGQTPLYWASKKLAARLSSLVEIRDTDINFLLKKAVDYK